MDAELKQKWITALRSGKYTQGQDALEQKSDDGTVLCCLGVLCRVAEIPATVDDVGVSWFENSDNLLPPKRATQFGISIKEERALVDLNDNEEYNFQQISEWIEDNL